MNMDENIREEAEDFLEAINEVMRSVREERMGQERDREDDERVYFLESRQEFYPLQIISRAGRD
jgi:hypothetical protein